MKVNKSILEDIKGTVSAINNRKDNGLNILSVIRKAYLVDINNLSVSSISDLVCHPSSCNFESAATIMAIANKYAFQGGVQSPTSINTAIGVWVANSGFDESSTRQAREMSESYKKMWDSGMIICVLDNNVKMLED